MLFLVLSFLCTAALLLMFKVFERFKVEVFQAIVFNYITAAACGFIGLTDRNEVLNGQFIYQAWLPFAALLGIAFISIFYLTSLTTSRFGVSTASVAFKLGLVFPVLLAFLVYHESFNWIKLLGILFAFAAVILASIKEEEKLHHEGGKLGHFLPYIVFIGSGACDSMTQFANKKYLMHQGIEGFAMFIFVFAGIIGLVVLVYQLIKGTTKLNLKSAIGGLALGIPNYLSFLFLLKALATLSWGSSVVFPVSNLGTVATATLAGYFIFKEKISFINLLGLLFAGAAILLIVFAA